MQRQMQQYLFCLCSNLNPELFDEIESYNPSCHAVANQYTRVCHNCEYPIAERESYAYCPYCDHESLDMFDRVALLPRDRLKRCLVCESAVKVRHVDRFFRLLADQFAQLGALAEPAGGDEAAAAASLVCPTCHTSGRLRYSIELPTAATTGSSSSVSATSSQVELFVTCDACSASHQLVDSDSAAAATGDVTNNGNSSSTTDDNGNRHGDSGCGQVIDTSGASLDGVVAPYLCDRCPGASFGSLHPVDHRRGGDSVSSPATKAATAAKKSAAATAKAAAVQPDNEFEALYCVGCQSTIALYQSAQANGPASLADLRRVVQPHYSTGEAGLPRERIPVTRVDQLSPGDHVCFQRRGGYWHHGIVAAVHLASSGGDSGGGSFDLVHYNNYTEQAGSSSSSGTAASWWQWLRSGGSKGVVRIDSTDLAKEPQTYRLAYHCLDCYPPQRALQRALSQVDTASYHLLGENCEHLAVWAKSGEARSFQVERVRQYARQLRQKFGPHLVALSSAVAARAGRQSRTKLVVDESLAFALKVKQDLSDLLDRRISHQVFSRRFWRLLIQHGFAVVAFALFTMVAPDHVPMAGRAVFGVAGSLGEAVADLVLSSPTERPAENK